MTSSEVTRPDWTQVDEGWGRQAVDFATLSEPSNAREYVGIHQQLDVGRATRLLDIACGSGLAIELASVRGAECAGLDASPRLVAVACDRNPGADIRVGDMHNLPWEDDSFDAVTSFRGIWGTTPDALAEVLRVLRPGGQVGLTVWGHIKASDGAWALSPFRLASRPKVANQAAMVALGRPDAGEQLLAQHGFTDIRRTTIPMVWEFADPEHYARTLASTGPAYEAIQAVGEAAFHEFAVQVATDRVRDGLPLRAPIDVVGYIARKPIAEPVGSAVPDTGFIATGVGEPLQRLLDHDVETVGFGMNVSRMWAHDEDLYAGLFGLMDVTARTSALTFRQRGVIVSACAAALGDSYCALSWGSKLAGKSSPEIAAGVLQGDFSLLDDQERALAEWATAVASHPTTTRSVEVEPLRDAGYSDPQIFAITVYVGLRIAFSAINDALGVRPDVELLQSPEEVLKAVTYGRPIAGCV